MNTAQLASLLRSLLLAAGAALVEHNVVTGPQLHSIVNWLVCGASIAGPIIWSLWRKTHAQQAEQAVKLVNSVEAIVGQADTGNVRIVAGMPLKPVKPDPVPAAALLLLLSCAGLGLTGCGTVPQGSDPAAWAKIAGGTAEDIAATGVPIILDHNPAWAEPIVVIAAAIPAAFGDAAMTQDGISAAVASLGAKYGLGVEFQQLLSRAINRAVVDYGILTGKPIITGADPSLKLILEDIAAGLSQGVNDWQARQPPPTVYRHIEGVGDVPATYQRAFREARDTRGWEPHVY